MMKKRYSITLNENQLFLISRCIEDIHRFVCGDTSLNNTASTIGFSKEARKKINELHNIVTPELISGESYDWAGNGCKNTAQKKFIAQTYYLYREILHQIALANKSNNVYFSPTLRCKDSGDVINIITWKEK